ncbi:putative com1 regulatory protein [Erysiphe neolycopersici]|uniref:Putative com1 regulatory protein n=1 Tax=Erysiphe neolycopersici TaxID=212602 RepID=A0A420I0E1_9PEZI|nr:putative com1 regulatory protein [Erysiphe neolycopersici]
MSALVISGIGLDIKGLTTKSNNTMALPKAIGLTLSNRVIEDMIQSVRSGKTLQLSLDESPKISYGNKTQHFETADSTSCHEIIRTVIPNLIRPLAKAAVPHPPRDTFANSKMLSAAVAVVGQKLSPISAPVLNSVIEGKPLPSTNDNGQDAAVVALQNSLATESLRKAENTVKYVRDGSLSLNNKRGLSKTSKTVLSRTQSRPNNEFSGKSLPASPSLNPSSVPLSQKQAEQAKAARKPVIHLLAVSPLTERALGTKIPDSTAEDLKQALDKVGDLNETTNKWELRKAFYKELDVWCFKYSCQEDRQRAIDNAVKVFDKMRINISEPQWEKLLPRSERGTGKCLSKLQAQIAHASSQKLPKSLDLGRESPQKNIAKDETVGEITSKGKGEGKTMTLSQGPAAKTKKAIKDREAQAKRLLSKKPSSGKPASTKATNSKKTQPVGKDIKSSTTLSSEYVESSDEEDGVLSISTSHKPQKRPRENDDASFIEQNMSPAKKVKEVASHQNRFSDSSRTTSAGQYSFSSKSNKSNSPHKSSPLATSPPTNASDLQDSSDARSTAISPRPRSRPSTTSKSTIIKTNNSRSYQGRETPAAVTRRLRPEVTNLARRYKMFYPKYLALHEQLSSMGGRRDRKMEKDLLDMHSRLTSMKQKILAGIVNVSTG